MFWDLYQQYRIESTAGAVARLGDAVAHDEAAIKTALRLDDKVERLALICCAMFELMQETHNIPEERLKAKILEIDMRDGEADGRMRPRSKKCPKCEAMMSPQFGRCLFCGHQDAAVSAFR